ncbi:mitochondrial substrate carrier family protein ucpB-like [Acanthaster planci]|uniref:Mitochondrial substrate carrier family protein ucpB-like n=1 Tax=Acanthaster planci TaxID=133434 RepID=A0A8B7Z6D9_ACAPL|nr:mitochondrial substrate carrier family protein ucpB-like [Acanthaster planci]
MTTTNTTHASPRDNALRFCFAGIGGMCASFATNPVDVTKVRMQLDGELANQRGQLGKVYKARHYKGIVRGAVTIAREEGVLALYKGLTPALLREATYSTIRIGAYEPIKVLFGATDRHHTPLAKKLGAGATSGAIGSMIAVPTDLIRVRLQAQGHLSTGEQPRYRGFTHAFTDILRKEGFRGLYRGTSPTVQRAVIVTATQVPTYDHTKHTILNHGWMMEGPALHIVSAMTAGFMCAVTTSPVDLIKTRVMNQQIKGIPKSERRYQNGLDCLIKTVKSEGWLGLYKGFIPNWLRIGPHTIVSFFLFEYLRKKAGINPI